MRGVNWLGDAVMTTPALLRLREHFPAAHITLFCPEKIHGLWLNHPAVDAVITFDSRDGLLATARKLRAGQFDLAVVLPNSPRSAMEVFFAGIPERIGGARPWRNFFLTRTIPPRAGTVKMRKRTVAEIENLTRQNSAVPVQRPVIPPSAHQIHEYLHLVSALGANPEPLAPHLAVTGVELEAARAKFGLAGLSAPIFGLNPGAEYGPAKRWPAEKFIAAAIELQHQTNCLWLVFGGKNDAELAAHITAKITPPVGGFAPANLAGKTSLRELMALLKLCRVLLTNDTGPMHLAAALGTPVVAPFGSTSPELTGPVSIPGLSHHILSSDVPCSPCFLRECPIDFRCLNGISVARVVSAVLATQR